MKSLKEFRPLIKLVKEDLNKLIFASIIIFMSGICEVFTGYLNGKVVEEITMLDIKNALIFLGIYFVLEITMDGVVLHYANSILYKEESKLTRKLGFYTYKKALCLPPVAYEKMSSGEIMNRITSDADTLSFAFGRLLNMISSLVASIIVIVYVFINSWIIGLEIVGIVSILFLILKKYNPLLKDIHKERRKEQDKFTSLTTESIRGIREIKTLGIKNNLISDMTSIIKDIYNKSSKEIDIQKSFNIKTRLLKSILECSVFATCVILLYYKMISLTFFIAMTYYVYRFTWLIENINDLTQTYQKVSVSISRVNDILKNRLYKDEEFGNKKLVNVKGVIEFKDVNFNYPDEGNILNNFSLKIEPNKKIAVLGESGINLSGGQKQRLSIARTLSKGSEVILFDEATSALDNNSQDYIKKTIDNLVNDHTIVIVAHRLSTIMDADIIHVVDGGKVIATGNHKELLNSCKIYRNLYETESLNS